MVIALCLNYLWHKIRKTGQNVDALNSTIGYAIIPKIQNKPRLFQENKTKFC